MTTARCVLWAEHATLALGEALRQGEAEAESRRVVGVAEPLEGCEDLLLPRRGDAGAVIDDPKLGRRTQATRRDPHAGIDGGMMVRIRQHVHHDPLQQDGVGVDGWKIGIHCELHGVGAQPEFVDRREHDL